MLVEIACLAERDHAEALSDALLASGALSATIEDADAGAPEEEPLFGEPGVEMRDAGWRRNRVVALFDADVDTEAALATACAASGIERTPPVVRREVAEADWVGLTQSQFAPVAIGRRLWIVPSWHVPPAESAGAVVVRLDPGMAFGTGDHPTTRLCLAWLDAHLEPGERVIDYGCGSGILAIAAKKLGAGAVVATDIDDQAVRAATANAEDNDVDIRVVPSNAFAASPADVVVANILSNPLKVLAPHLAALVAPGGRLVLSGILERQWPEVAAAYAPAVSLEVWETDAGWVCLAGTRPRTGH